nr:protein CutA, chloroplastic [Ipomoea batatas]GME20980.1 protein CutA, chloroplastic [Ipomoea batatas]
MALRLSAIASSTLIRRRLPLVGAFCVLTFGLSNLSVPFSKTGCAQSLPFAPLFRSKSRAQSASVHSVRMEASDKTVPSIVVYVTVPNKEAGKKLAESIVKEKLAACVNRVPGVESVYEWDGKIQSDSEELLIIKTRESLLEALTAHVNANHEYDVPEVIALPIVGGSPRYLEWIKNTTREK